MSIDVLGPAYDAREIPLAPDVEGDVVATLVRRDAAHSTGRAVLYVHGWADYFFQDHLAEFWIAQGYTFYALDLRKYGRSLRPHHTPNHCTDLSVYAEELDAAAAIIRDDGNQVLVVNAHSTGGLITSLWAHHRPGVVAALVLNSAWLDLNRTWFERTVVTRAVDMGGVFRPEVVIEQRQPDHYGRSLHRDHRGQWDYDLRWKPLGSFPVTAGWIRAIRRGHARVAGGLDIRCPVLVACSTRSVSPKRWSHEITRADAVLNVRHIVGRAPLLGPLVTIAQIDGGVHDLALSSRQPRERYFGEVRRWCATYVGAN